ncbi:class I SAM-dependent methyltransferase [Pseudomonas quasicaspiana]|nr:class I SAM-dependent methyltransferase [Pseudomonas syringae]MDG6400794.1 class I SAM-dependent methyltransferase [Pseudomonas quasicaspiana]
MHKELYRSSALPVLQNRTFADADAARSSVSADLILVQDLDTGLIYNHAFDPQKLCYDSGYQNEQAHSGYFKAHLDAAEQIISKHMGDMSLIEVGCGKGYFLEQLRDHGFDIVGIDPAYEGQSPYVVKAPFTREAGLAADAVILRHVLEHIPDPMTFLQSIAEANDGGLIYIEVPCMDWILEHKAWFDVFYEHVNYFRLEDFHRLFSTVHEAGHLFGGQYLYVVADLGSLRSKPLPAAPEVQMPADFMLSIKRALSIIQASPDKPVGIWGAASKGVIYSLFLQRAGVEVDQVIDINPAKQGRYLPLSGLRVSSPEQAMLALPDGAHLFVMNSNYLEEIKRMTDERYVYHAVDAATFV